MMKKTLFLFTAAVVLALTSCNKDGCIDPTALNYDSNAEKDDGSCVYPAQNLNFKFYHKLGNQDFALNTEVQSESGRLVKFTRAQMYMSGFSFNGTGGAYQIDDPYLLVKPSETDYNLGYLPEDMYSSFTLSGGVDSVANHSDPAAFPGTSALSSNNPDHMHWGWDPGYIFYVLEGMVDTSAAMNGNVDAPFIFHVGMDAFRVDMAFATNVNAVATGVTVEMDIDWLTLLDGTNMTSNTDTRSTHTMNNPALANIMAENVDDAISLH